MWERLHIKVVVAIIVGAVLISGGVWVLVTRRNLPPEFAESLPSSANRLTTLHVSRDGKQLIAGSAEGQVVVWEWPSRKRTLLEPGSTQPLVALAESDDGLLIASGLHGQLRAWQLPEFERVKLESPQVAVTAITYQHREAERAVILGLADGRIATLTGGKLKLRKSGHRGVKGLALTKEQDVLVSVGTEGKLIWFDLKSSKPLATSSAHQTEISVLLPTADQSRVITADWNGRVCCWDIASRSRLWDVQQPDAVSGACWLGEQLVTGSWDGRLRVWSLKSMPASIDQTIDTGLPIYCLASIPNDRFIVTVSASPHVELWKLP